MVITYDNSAVKYFVNPSYSSSYTMGVGDGGILICNTTPVVSAITYGGVGLTKSISFNSPISDGNGVPVDVYILKNPPTGSNTLTVTVGGGVNADVGVVSYLGVDTDISQPVEYATGYSNNGTNNTQVASLTTNISTTKDKSWVVMCTRGGNNYPRMFTAGSGVLRQTDTQLFGDNAWGIIDSNGVITPAGSTTLQASWTSSSGFISNVLFSLSPKVSGGFMNYFL